MFSILYTHTQTHAETHEYKLDWFDVRINEALAFPFRGDSASIETSNDGDNGDGGNGVISIVIWKSLSLIRVALLRSENQARYCEKFVFEG